MQNSHTRSSVSVKFCCLSLFLSLPLSHSFSLQSSGSLAEKNSKQIFFFLYLSCVSWSAPSASILF